MYRVFISSDAIHMQHSCYIQFTIEYRAAADREFQIAREILEAELELGDGMKNVESISVLWCVVSCILVCVSSRCSRVSV
jgi:hypothetical protein